jgi:hypothetical protein
VEDSQATRRYFYRYTTAVPPGTYRAARAAAQIACNELDVTVTLRWFEPCAEADADFHWHEDVAGQMDERDGTVNIRSDLSQVDTVRTVAHEVRHAWQLTQVGSWDHGHRAVLERDAEHYEDHILQATRRHFQRPRTRQRR